MYESGARDHLQYSDCDDEVATGRYLEDICTPKTLYVDSYGITEQLHDIRLRKNKQQL